MSANRPVRSAQAVKRSRLIITLVAVAVAAALAVAIWFALAGNGGASGDETVGTPTTSASATPSPEPTSPGESAEPAPAPTVDPDFGDPVADRAPLDEQADFGGNVSATMVAVQSITAEGTQAGEVTGPAVQVDLQLANGTAEAFSLETVTVNAYYGSDLTPASPYFEPADAHFSGILAAGATAQGRYVFSVPEGQQSDVVVTLSLRAGTPIVVLG